MPESGDTEPAPETAAEDTAAEAAGGSEATESSEETVPDPASMAASADAAEEAEKEDTGAETAVDAAEPEADEGETQDAGAPSEIPEGMAAALGFAAGGNAEDAENAEEEEPARRRRFRKPAAAPRKPRRSMAKILSLFVLILLVGGIAGAAFFFNQKIMMWMPATQRLYAMVGLKPHVLGQGLQIVEPTPKKEVDGNDEILVVEGEIRNTTANPVNIPLMRGALLDDQGEELHVWTFTAAKSTIEPGENARYRTEFRNPPTNAESLDITFTRANAVMEASKPDAKMEKKPDDAAGKEPAESH